ncbi:hypothetical protein AC1031_007527 [Aphanomyces cochlioides]|nr:hypothetical protein AC1031_007527 [Aphanomyces cochlioides]
MAVGLENTVNIRMYCSNSIVLQGYVILLQFEVMTMEFIRFEKPYEHVVVGIVLLCMVFSWLRDSFLTTAMLLANAQPWRWLLSSTTYRLVSRGIAKFSNEPSNVFLFLNVRR